VSAAYWSLVERAGMASRPHPVSAAVLVERLRDAGGVSGMDPAGVRRVVAEFAGSPEAKRHKASGSMSRDT